MIENKKLKQALMVFLGVLVSWVGTEQFGGLVEWGNTELLGIGIPAAVTAALGSLLSIVLFTGANWYRDNRLTEGGRLTASAEGDRF